MHVGTTSQLYQIAAVALDLEAQVLGLVALQIATSNEHAESVVRRVGQEHHVEQDIERFVLNHRRIPPETSCGGGSMPAGRCLAQLDAGFDACSNGSRLPAGGELPAALCPSGTRDRQAEEQHESHQAHDHKMHAWRSLCTIQVDASGQIALPLVGSVEAEGKTASELSTDIEKLFGEKYLKDPQVTVSVATSVSQRVSIQGEVTEPGVYQVSGPTTLLEVLSMAKGETDIAKLNEVVIFRNINGQRMGAVFDVASIRRGQAMTLPCRERHGRRRLFGSA